MKSKLSILLFVLNTSLSLINAGNTESGTIVIDGTKFTYPLVEKWISEYSKIRPNTIFKIATKGNNLSSDITLIAHEPLQNELSSSQKLIYTGEYALIPVTNDFNPQLSSFPKRGLSKKEIDKLFFEVIDYESDEPIQKSKFMAKIYTSDNKASTSTALAKYFGHSVNEIRGRKVLGDETHLISAIKRDSIALTYNTLNSIYDTNTRRLKSGLAIIPVNLKKGQKEVFSANLDVVITFLENNQVESIPVEKIGFVLSQSNDNKELKDFLSWILTEGQQFNKSEGFLALDKKLVCEQLNKFKDNFLTQK